MGKKKCRRHCWHIDDFVKPDATLVVRICCHCGLREAIMDEDRKSAGFHGTFAPIRTREASRSKRNPIYYRRSG